MANKRPIGTHVANSIERIKKHPLITMLFFFFGIVAFVSSLPELKNETFERIGQWFPEAIPNWEAHNRLKALCREIESVPHLSECIDNDVDPRLPVELASIKENHIFEYQDFRHPDGPNINFIGFDGSKIRFITKGRQCPVYMDTSHKIISDRFYIIIFCQIGGTDGEMQISGYRLAQSENLESVKFVTLKPFNIDTDEGKQKIEYDDALYIVDQEEDTITGSIFGDSSADNWIFNAGYADTDDIFLLAPHGRYILMLKRNDTSIASEKIMNLRIDGDSLLFDGEIYPYENSVIKTCWDHIRIVGLRDYYIEALSKGSSHDWLADDVVRLDEGEYRFRSTESWHIVPSVKLVIQHPNSAECEKPDMIMSGGIVSSYQ